jgi:signal peptidase I
MSYDDQPVAADLRRTPSPVPPDAWRPPGDPVAAPPPAVDAGPARPAGRTASRAAREILETLLLALVIFLGVRLLVLNFRVDGSSMFPNLHNREMLLVNRNAYATFDLNEVLNLLPGDDRDGEWNFSPFAPPERGDIVVFDPPLASDKPYIKRVIGLPGETVEIRNGGVYIDGQELEEPYIRPGSTSCPGECEPVTVPEDHVFVLGDNRDNSSDSRMFGAIPVDDIVGKAWFTYWPVDELGLVPHYDYPGLAER